MEELSKLFESSEEKAKENSENEFFKDMAKLCDGRDINDVLKVLAFSIIAQIELYCQKTKACDNGMLLTFIHNIIGIKEHCDASDNSKV